MNNQLARRSRQENTINYDALSNSILSAGGGSNYSRMVFSRSSQREEKYWHYGSDLLCKDIGQILHETSQINAAHCPMCIQLPYRNYDDTNYANEIMAECCGGVFVATSVLGRRTKANRMAGQ